MLTSGRLPRSEYGGPLFVLGAVKVNDAEHAKPCLHAAASNTLIASRYLTEARAYGLPPVREAKGFYLLGQSLSKAASSKRACKC